MERITKRVPIIKPMAKIKPSTITATATTQEGFIQTLAALDRGSRIIYHTGHLLSDRYISPGDTGEERRRRQAIGSFARFVYKMYENGKVLLVQRRLTNPFGCEYIAVKL